MVIVNQSIYREPGKKIHDAVKHVSRNREFYPLFGERRRSKNSDTTEASTVSNDRNRLLLRKLSLINHFSSSSLNFRTKKNCVSFFSHSYSPFYDDEEAINREGKFSCHQPNNEECSKNFEQDKKYLSKYHFKTSFNISCHHMKIESHVIKRCTAIQQTFSGPPESRQMTEDTLEMQTSGCSRHAMGANA
uniref:Uncharacterized protein n=1 Tax=Romanomermis culicivorax TaxID=13658 RepID=A0A915JPR7_ROMCU